MSQTSFDLIVLGGGLVGASFALAMAQQGRRVALIEGQRLDGLELETGWDARIYAISPQNLAFLDRLGAGPDRSRVGTVASMDVRGDRGGRLRFAAADIGAAELAVIAENRWMLAALWQRVHAADIAVFDGARVERLQTNALRAFLTLGDGTQLDAALLVGADGANSWVRGQMGLEASIKPYGQSGVVANFACEKPHGDCARQWFFGDSVLAWLPLPGNRLSMVWSTFEPDRLTSLSDAGLADTVARAGNRELGALTTLTPASAFPLRLIRPQGVIARRVALIGDAAHTVHPLAGQGVNLGFQDAEVLADGLVDADDIGAWARLRRYERARREAVRTMQYTCDGLFELFHRQTMPGLDRLRNAGLSLVDRLGPLKRQLARHAAGR
jgi:ubiquinone biosynthesis UbiH/UbiF/VisC/COQ6 family hydroxylase